MIKWSAVKKNHIIVIKADAERAIISTTIAMRVSAYECERSNRKKTQPEKLPAPRGMGLNGLALKNAAVDFEEAVDGFARHARNEQHSQLVLLPYDIHLLHQQREQGSRP